ncbi:MAG: hypothetical protein EWM73_00883 [Nitrospira sp.]|nr:MAG: hypothetical protein EWM73_00883 [Nitrospira sp.]
MEKSEVNMPGVRIMSVNNAFTLKTVQLVGESTHPVAQVARDLGIPDNAL